MSLRQATRRFVRGIFPIPFLAGIVLWTEWVPYPSHLQTVHLFSDAVRHHPAISLYHPVWSGIIQALGDVFPAHVLILTASVHLAGAVIFLSLTGIVLRLFLIDLPRHLPAPPSVMHRACGLGLFALAALPPFRRIVLHPHPVLIEATLLLAALVLFIHAVRHHSRWRLVLAGLVAGLAALETALAWPLIPLLAATLRWGTNRAHRLPASIFLAAAATCALPAIAYLHARHPSFSGGAEEVFFVSDWVGTLIRGHLILARSQLFHPGWILNLIMTVGLCAAALWTVGYRVRSHRRWLVLFLLLVFTAVHIALFVPSPLPSYQAMCFTALPWIFTALTISLLLSRLAGWRHRHDLPIQWNSARFDRFGAVVVLLILVAWWQTRADLQNRDLEPVHDLAMAQIDQLPEDTVVLSNGALDPWLRLAAHTQRRRFFILRPLAMKQPAYAWEAAQILPELNDLPDPPWTTVEAARWLQRNPHLIDRLRILDAPDPWTAAGFAAVPEVLVFRGAETPDPSGLVKEFESLLVQWDVVRPRLERLSRRADASAMLGQYLKALGSRQFNQMGIVLERSGRPDQAATAYRMSQRLLPDNLSATLNLALLNQPALSPDEVQALIQGFDLHLPFSLLLQRYGHISSPEALAPLLSALRATRNDERPSPASSGIRHPLFDAGMALYEAGQLGAAKAVFERLALHHDTPTVLNNLAWIELALGNLDSAQRWVNLSLARWPQNAAALDTLGSIYMARGQFEIARDYFQQAMTLNTSHTDIRRHWQQAESALRISSSPSP